MAKLRRVGAQSLVLDPALVGHALAPPWRRGVALAIDAALLLLPTIAVSAGAAALSLRLSQPEAWRALRALVLEEPPPERARSLAADLAPLLVEIDADGLPVDLAYAVEHGDRARVERLMDDLDILLAIGPGPPRAANSVIVPVDSLIPAGARTLALLGVPALYFTLCHRGRRGATVGKRLMGLTVRRLSGEPLGMLDSLERFGGYFGIPGTVGIGLVELWRHPLRQLGHDRGAGRIFVLEQRQRSRPAPVTAPEPAEPPGAGASEGPSRRHAAGPARRRKRRRRGRP